MHQRRGHTHTGRGARGFVLPPASPPGNPHAEKLLPATVDELQAVGLKPRKVAMDGGFLVRCNYGLSRTPNRPRRTAAPGAA